MSSLEHAGHSIDRVERMLVVARRGEHSQLGVLLDLYRGYLLTIAAGSLGRDVSVKVAPSDLVQETLMQASVGFVEFRGSTELELRTWLTQILKRKAIDVHRHYKSFAKRDIAREVPLRACLGGHREMLDLVGSAVPPSGHARADENSRILQAALSKLNEDQRQAIQLRSFEQLDFDEIGARLGRSAEAARKLWARAVQTLTVELRFHEPNPSRPL